MKRLAIVAAALMIVIGGYLLAIVLLPRDEPKQEPGSTFTVTQTIPGIGSGGLTGTGTR